MKSERREEIGDEKIDERERRKRRDGEFRRTGPQASREMNNAVVL